MTIMEKALIILVLLGVGCGRRPEQTLEPKQTAPVVYTTFYPTYYFAQRIGSDLIDVRCPLPPDEDPIFWMPDGAAIQDYQQADLIVLNGAGLEKWIDKVSLPNGRVVDTASEFADDYLRFEDAMTHSHGPTGEHTHEGIDGHTWLDPVLAKKQAETIYKRLLPLLPEHERQLQSNFASLCDDLERLHQAFMDVTKRLDGQHLLASHPAYNYVAKRYQWTVSNLDLDPGKTPDEDTFTRIRTLVKTKPATLILWESPPVAEIAQRFQSELGLISIVFSPCENRDTSRIAEGEDYLGVMQQNIQRLSMAVVDRVP